MLIDLFKNLSMTVSKQKLIFHCACIFKIYDFMKENNCLRHALISPFCRFRFHTFETSQVRKVLAAHSLGGLRSENQIRSVLQSRGAPSLDSDSSDDDAVFSFPTNRATYDKVKSKLTSSTSPRQSSTEVDDSVDEKTEICGFNLRGKCSYGSRCHAVHCGKY